MPTEKPRTRTVPRQHETAPKRAATTKRKAGPKHAAPKPAATKHPPAKHPAAKHPAAKNPAGKGAPAKRATPKPALKSVILDALDDMKALEVRVLDVRGLTDIADFMVIASGTSDRHVRSAAQRVVEKTKEAGFRPHGVEGAQDGDWVLIDLHEYIVHVMLPRVREFYGLEKLWDMTAKRAVRA